MALANLAAGRARTCSTSRARSRRPRYGCEPGGRERSGAARPRRWPRPRSSGVLAALEAERPAACVIDSIQTLHTAEMSGAPGSVGQVREAAGRSCAWPRRRGTAVLLVGHVTKEGALAGPRVLEHLVDCVLQFEGERERTYRTLRALKNRFGSTNEIGVFEMTRRRPRRGPRRRRRGSSAEATRAPGSRGAGRDGGHAAAAGRGAGARERIRARAAAPRRQRHRPQPARPACWPCSRATAASAWGTATCSSTSSAGCGSTSPARTSPSPWPWPAPRAERPWPGRTAHRPPASARSG